LSTWRLAFGTSTFAAGRLRPGKDSQPGIAALAAALARGLRVIHSNPSLGTQWAVRDAVTQADRPDGVRHVVKVQLPLHLAPGEIERRVDDALIASARNLGVSAVDTAVIEADVKRTEEPGLLADGARVSDVYARAARRAVAAGLAQRSAAYCHSPAHLAACLQVDELTGYAAQYNLVEAWPGLFLDAVTAQRREFLAMAPLARGRLAGWTGEPAGPPLPALRWVLGHPGVTSAVLTMSTLAHLDEAAAAAQRPLAEAIVRSQLSLWQSGQPLAGLPVPAACPRLSEPVLKE
jgi:aryl-alcohol dehydrogenase-like predicted oxidoreductase